MENISYTSVKQLSVMDRAYVHSVREKAYSESSKGYARVVASSCCATITGICTAFVSTGRSNPSLEEAGKTSFLLHQQFRGYTNNDPSSKPQKAIPLKLLQEMVQRPCSDPGLIAYHQLTILAFFFAMRSCEYLKTTGERRTIPSPTQPGLPLEEQDHPPR